MDFDNIVFDDIIPDLEIEGDGAEDGGDAMSVIEGLTAPLATTWVDDGDHAKFLEYALGRLNNLPRHSGKTTAGCERVLAELRRLDKELSRALQSDDKCLIDEDQAEKLRDTIYDYIEKLETALDKLLERKRKKKADLKIGKTILVRLADGSGEFGYYLPVSDNSGEMLLPVSIEEPTAEQCQALASFESGLHKEAGTARIMLVADPFLHEITKIIIEGTVSRGKNIDEVYAGLDSKYKFTDREHLAIQSLLKEKGMPMNKDLSRLGDKDIYPWDGKGNASKIYPA